jgi:hydrogenase expression/formation protein HypD
MKYVDEYRDGEAARAYAETLRELVTKPWTLMEVCGGQTHAIVKYGVDRLLPDEVELIHGPGCPVCVTDVEIIDRAVALASRDDVILCSFGDMLRVPGTSSDLLHARAGGGDVRVVYSPLDVLPIAEAHPDKEVVFLAVGFETTAPANAALVLRAEQAGLSNVSLLIAHVLVPPALEALLASPQCRVQGFLAAGHVCAVMGTEAYEPIAEKYGVPIVVTGFEPVDILQGVTMCVRQLEEGRAEVENQYARAVRASGNRAAQQMVERVFTVQARRWRGLGEIPASGLGLRDELLHFDAAARLGPFDAPGERADSECRAGDVLQGLLRPDACPAFGTRCTPERPLGAPMVSSEGACAAYYRYRGEEAA